MKVRVAWLLASLLLGTFAAKATAQPATTVQLPTFSFFSTATTVSVPDRGNVYMGGVNRAATGRNEFGVPLAPFRPFRNTAIGTERSASSIRVSAYIHDFEAMEERLLGQPASTIGSVRPRQPQVAVSGARPQPRPATQRGAWNPSTWTADVDRRSTPAMNLAEVQTRRENRKQARGGEAAGFFARGQKAEAEGKLGAAKIYYQMASRRASGELKVRIAARLQAISPDKTLSKVAQSRP